MNRISTLIALAMTCTAMLTASCGNADARNEDKTQKKEKTQVTAAVKAKELNAAEFNTKVFVYVRIKGQSFRYRSLFLFLGKCHSL